MNLTEAQQNDLLDEARAARLKAHAPYSRFRVGAAVLADDGTVYGGCNVENAAYPEGICAETAAIAAMVLAGGRAIRAIAIVGGRRDGASGPWVTLTPCGGCRQRIREFAGPDVPVLLATPEGLRQTLTLGALLPHAFGPDLLKAGEEQGRHG